MALLAGGAEQVRVALTVARMGHECHVIVIAPDAAAGGVVLQIGNM